MASVRVFAVPVTDGDAAFAAERFVAAGGAMDVKLEGGVSEVRALSAPDGASPFRVVKFADGGFIVTSGDTEDDPFVFISDGDGDVVEDDENPLWGILRSDMSANEAVRSANSSSKPAGARLLVSAQSAPEAENKWAKWLPAETGRMRSQGGTPVPGTSISDVCVPRIMDVRWNQRGSGNAPHYYNDAIPHHCAVGCVAVAMAQIIRHHQWPSSIGNVKRKCGVWNGLHGDDSRVEDVLLTTSGATYDWSAMPAAPDLCANPTGQDEVSRFLYDAGITVRMNWKAPDDETSEDGGSGGSTIREAADALKEVWQYVDAVWTPHNGLVPEPPEDEDDPPDTGSERVFKRVKDIYLPCLAAGMPVMASISGHDVVADGYGYSDGDLYFHINYGWGGTNSSSAVTKNTGWYFARGPIQGHENGLGATIYNISPNPVGSLFSGRIYATDGSPLGNFPVYAVGTNGVRHTALSNAAGVYVFNLDPGSYVVSATNGNEIAYGEVVTLKNRSTSDGQSQGTVGNVSEVDLHLVQRQGSVCFWTGAGDGTRFGDPANWDVASIPAPGSTIIFPATESAVAQRTLNNDLSASAFCPAEIIFQPSSPCYTITNNPIYGLSAIVNSSSVTNVFKVPVMFTGDIDVTGRVAFTDGGSANGAKPVNHTEFLGVYNLTAPDWEPSGGATIVSNSVVNVQSMLLHSSGSLIVREGGLLNVESDVVLTTNRLLIASIARSINGRINIGGWLKIEDGAGGRPCEYGSGTIRAYGIYSNSRYGPFHLCDSSSMTEVLHWEIGAGGLAKGPNRRVGDSSYSCAHSLGDGVEIKALDDFVVQGEFYMANPILLNTDGHAITFDGVIDEVGTLTVSGGGMVRIAGDTRYLDYANAKLKVRVNVEGESTLALDSGSLLTSNRVAVAEGATLAVTLTDPTYGATLAGTLSMAAGSTLVVSNYTGSALPPLAVGSFEKTGEGKVYVRVAGPEPATGRIFLADGFGDASADDFEWVECGILPSGAEYVFDVSGGRLFYGPPVVDCVWKGTSSIWGDPGAWRNQSSGSDMTWADMNYAYFTAPAQVTLAANATALGVFFAADASVSGNGLLSAISIDVAQGATASISAPLSSGVVKTGSGVLALSRSREGKETVLTEGTLRFSNGGDIGSFVFGTDPEKKVVLDYGGNCLETPLLTDLLRVGMDETLTNGVFGTGNDVLSFTEANLPAVLTIATDAVVKNRQFSVNVGNGSSRTIDIAGGTMTCTRNGNHWLMQGAMSGRLDINVTDGGLLEFNNELYALTSRDNSGHVDPSLHMTFKDSTFRIKNDKSFRFGLDGSNKNAVSPVGVFAATNSVIETYGFYIGNDTVGANIDGSYTADFESCIVSARQVRVFHDRPLNAIRFNNTRLVLTGNEDDWLSATNAFNSVWNRDPISVGEGGLVLDTNNRRGSLRADIQGAGAITKDGSGTLIVECNQTGTGPLVCTDGTICIPGGISVMRPVEVRSASVLTVGGESKSELTRLSLDNLAMLNIVGDDTNSVPLSVSELVIPESGRVALVRGIDLFPPGIYAILEAPGITVSEALEHFLPFTEYGFGYRFFVTGNVLMLYVGDVDYTYVPALAPTCETPGHTAYLENEDGVFYDVYGETQLTWSDIEIPALGHDWRGWTVVTPPTYAAPGVESHECTRCGARETRELPMLRLSTFAIASSISGTTNMLTITRSSTNVVETVYCRTIGLSAFAGQHFASVAGKLTFAVGEKSKLVKVVETTPSRDAYKFQTGTTRSYSFEVTDEGGFTITNKVRNITTGTQLSSSYMNTAVTNLVYFSNSGSLQSGTGNKYLDVNYGPTSYRQVTDGGYKQAVHTVSTGSLYGNNAAVRTFLNSLGFKMYATVYFTQKEEQDGYQYIQILADNATTYDGNDPDGSINSNDPSLSLYKACFILSYDPSGSVMENDHYQFFPHRYDYVDKAAETKAGISQYEFDYDNSHLYKQKFRSSSFKTLTSGSLVLPTTITNLNIRFDAAGSGGDTWDFKNLKVRLALVDSSAPYVINLSVAPGIHSRGNNFYVSLAFNEPVTVTGAPTLTTSWGNLTFNTGSGSNVLTFKGKISANTSENLSVTGFSGTVKDLAGNAFGAFATADNVCPLDASHSYSIYYNLEGGALPDGSSNPTNYTYDTPRFTLVNPLRAGYAFNGWSGTGISGLANEVVVAKNSHGTRIYVANWALAFPPYLDGAAELVLSNYVAWAEAYGADTTGTHLAQFLLNVSPDSAPAELRITGIEVGAEGASVGVGATAGGDAVDLSKINGILSVASGDEPGSLAPKAVPPSNVRYEKGDAAILVPSSAGPFIRARIGVAAPTE